jgi:formamidopyrimidine-DNA glycosylase
LPELPDISLYVLRLRERILDVRLTGLRIYSPFVLRTFAVKPSELAGLACTDVSRLGKRIVLSFEDRYWAVIHLMIAGRLQWKSPLPAEKAAPGKTTLAAFRFESGELSLVEFSTKKRASIYLHSEELQLQEHRRSGLNVFECDIASFSAAIREPNRTLKRALTDPRTLDGVGNAYSDEIMFTAKLSPVRRSASLDEEEIERLLGACRKTLSDWTERLRADIPGFPKPGEITAFRPGFATHGKFGQPCPVCGSPIQHIVYAENETNYCAKCQNEGRLLADRSLSRLLKADWPRTLEEMDGG